ncbi:MAG TPA: flagellar hook basal-body protein [Planctomycetaceae bacterium]|jgi:flagellar basal body rod protein FlgG
MIYGLYLSGQGAQMQMIRQDVVANNLANASTTAFKRELLIAQAHPPFDSQHGNRTWLPGNLDNLPGGVSSGGTSTDFSQGELQRTQGSFDLAIQGKGFLKVANGKEVYLTRNGQLSVGPQNQLVTRDQGYPVLSTEGAPFAGLDPALPIDVHPDGSVMQGVNSVGKLALVEPQNYSDLTKVGKNMFSTSGRTAPASPETQVKQGYLEDSGVRPVTSMMELIESSRTLEANVNMIKTQDDSLDRLLQSLPRK